MDLIIRSRIFLRELIGETQLVHCLKEFSGFNVCLVGSRICRPCFLAMGKPERALSIGLQPFLSIFPNDSSQNPTEEPSEMFCTCRVAGLRIGRLPKVPAYMRFANRMFSLQPSSQLSAFHPFYCDFSRIQKGVYQGKSVVTTIGKPRLFSKL